ncbi:MAG: SDR family oxidoreductase [Pigmentiphaga sp.]|uniref:SDR family oxidoreductase n=1 Tax=Pigmentiphaga sp. TaxID=1977564 RepID=UPI0029B0DD85|nr:SDR family oxidoreductase [Pigmentiphaga sp.]MDX3905991.1 SDR family oxidoreductase [Pigmentiphaga sp.]
MKVFITGASSGIGQAFARQYAARGASLGLVGRREQALRELAASLPGTHHCYAVDVRNRPALHEAAGDFLAHGGIDLVIANAGISTGTLTEEMGDFDAFRAVIDTNLVAMVATFEPFIPAMKQAGRGQLAGIASVAGIRGLPGAGAYSASKAAVIAYCESLRSELSPYGIRVSTLAPGYIRTPMTARNPYPMPFLMDADAFAARAARALDRGTRYTVIPWQMAIVAKLMRLIPDPLYDRLAVRAPRKPRHS